jgi:D-alanyl-D-alanine-carboxypeptidase/D-alanyl-D-alanine-endopeptidase
MHAQSSLPSDAEIRKILMDRVDTHQQSVGVVVGVIDPAGSRVISYGRLEKNDPRPLNGDTVFEIGSVTKVFTSLVLADMVQHGEVSLTDPISKFLPPGTKTPERGGRSITLVDLATQSSGLPRMPNNFAPKDPANPYADYSVEQLYQFLATVELTRDIGSKYEYSNVGVGLLGHLLSRRAGTDYESLVRSRICAPLGMKSTGITLSPDLKARLAAGHDAAMKTVANWDLPIFSGAGALRSTANDMLSFLAANLGYTTTPLAPAMAAMLKTRRPTGIDKLEIGLGWHILVRDDREIVWHNGGTGGYRSFVGYDQKHRTGVVALANASTTQGVDDIGRHLLDPSLPLATFQIQKQVTLETKIYERYVGTYQFAPGIFLTATRDGDHLFMQLTGQDKYEIFPKTDHDFFYKVVEAGITFETDPQGKATALVLHQNGRDQRAKRIEGDAPKPKEHQAIKVDPKIFDGYVGRYQLAPEFIITVTRDGNQLYLQATNQPRFEVFPESDRDYFLKVVDAQITFETDPQGKASALVLHQNGLDQRAKRME